MATYTLTLTDEQDLLLAWGAEQYNASMHQPPMDEEEMAPFEPLTLDAYALFTLVADLNNRRSNALALTRDLRQMLTKVPVETQQVLLDTLNSPALIAYVQYLQTQEPVP